MKSDRGIPKWAGDPNKFTHVGIACPECGSDLGLVIDSRPSANKSFIRRRRVCRAGHRFTTYETAEPRHPAEWSDWVI